jgi:hypothetical protein
MSTCLIIGFLGVANGRREQTMKINRGGREMRVFHMRYDTSIQILEGVVRPADLRVYSPINDAPLMDNTVGFVVAKACFPNDTIILLDAFYMNKVPGNPNKDSYEDAAPDVPIPVTVSDYMHDEQRTSSLM